LLSKQSDFKWERLHTEDGRSSIRLSEINKKVGISLTVKHRIKANIEKDNVDCSKDPNYINKESVNDEKILRCITNMKY